MTDDPTPENQEKATRRCPMSDDFIISSEDLTLLLELAVLCDDLDAEETELLLRIAALLGRTEIPAGGRTLI